MQGRELRVSFYRCMHNGCDKIVQATEQDMLDAHGYLYCRDHAPMYVPRTNMRIEYIGPGQVQFIEPGANASPPVCRWCKGTGKITLLTSVTDCECVK